MMSFQLPRRIGIGATAVSIGLAMNGCCDCAPRPGQDLGVYLDAQIQPDLSMATSLDMSCVAQYKFCWAPSTCCPGLECVGGACAKVP
jgi:hypothetical protein